MGDVDIAEAHYKYAAASFTAVAKARPGNPLYRKTSSRSDQTIDELLLQYKKSKIASLDVLLRQVTELMSLSDAVRFDSEETIRQRGHAELNLALLYCRKKRLSEAQAIFDELFKDKDCGRAICECELAALAAALGDGYVECKQDSKATLAYMQALDLLAKYHHPRTKPKTPLPPDQMSFEEKLLSYGLKSFTTVESPLSPEHNKYDWSIYIEPRTVVPDTDSVCKRVTGFFSKHPNKEAAKMIGLLEQGMKDEDTESRDHELLKKLKSLARDERRYIQELDANAPQALANLQQEAEQRQMCEGLVADVSTALNDIGYELLIRGYYPEAKSYLQRALTIREQAGPAATAAQGQTFTNLAQILLDEGRFSEAEALLLKSKNLRKSDETDKLAVFRTDLLLGRLYTLTGRYKEAESLFDSAMTRLSPARVSDETLLEMDEELFKTYGDDSNGVSILSLKTARPSDWQFADLLANLGEFYFQEQQFDKTTLLLRRALIFRYTDRFEPEKIGARCYELLARTAIAQQGYQNAEEMLRMGEQIAQHELSDKHPTRAEIFIDWGKIHERKGNQQKAKESYQNAINILEQTQSADSSRIKELKESVQKLSG